MTAAEAIKQLKIEYVGEWDADRAAKNIAIAALDKQIPKKPKHVRGYGKNSTAIGLCPTCGGGNNSEYPCCGFCGQAIDWGEEEYQIYITDSRKKGASA